MIVKIDGKYYEEVEPVNGRLQIRDEIDKLNLVIDELRKDLSTGKVRLDNVIIERDLLKEKLIDLNK